MYPRILVVLPLLLASLLVSSCNTFEIDPNDPNSHLIQDVENVRQGPMQCGTASLTMVLRYYNIGVSLTEIDEKARKYPDKGTSCLAMVEYPILNQKLNARSFASSNPNILKRFVKNDFPLIVLGKSEGNDIRASCHYAVLVGYNKDGFIINDPLSGLRFKSYKNFKEWHTCKRCGHYWTVAIYPEEHSQVVPSPHFE